LWVIRRLILEDGDDEIHVWMAAHRFKAGSASTGTPLNVAVARQLNADNASGVAYTSAQVGSIAQAHDVVGAAKEGARQLHLLYGDFLHMLVGGPEGCGYDGCNHYGPLFLEMESGRSRVLQHLKLQLGIDVGLHAGAKIAEKLFGVEHLADMGPKGGVKHLNNVVVKILDVAAAASEVDHKFMAGASAGVAGVPTSSERLSNLTAHLGVGGGTDVLVFLAETADVLATVVKAVCLGGESQDKRISVLAEALRKYPEDAGAAVLELEKKKGDPVRTAIHDMMKELGARGRVMSAEHLSAAAGNKEEEALALTLVASTGSNASGNDSIATTSRHRACMHFVLTIVAACLPELTTLANSSALKTGLITEDVRTAVLSIGRKAEGIWAVALQQDMAGGGVGVIADERLRRIAHGTHAAATKHMLLDIKKTKGSRPIATAAAAVESSSALALQHPAAAKRFSQAPKRLEPELPSSRKKAPKRKAAAAFGPANQHSDDEEDPFQCPIEEIRQIFDEDGSTSSPRDLKHLVEWKDVPGENWSDHIADVSAAIQWANSRTSATIKKSRYSIEQLSELNPAQAKALCEHPTYEAAWIDYMPRASAPHVPTQTHAPPAAQEPRGRRSAVRSVPAEVRLDPTEARNVMAALRAKGNVDLANQIDVLLSRQETQ
jgi:hypothetical protein